MAMRRMWRLRTMMWIDGRFCGREVVARGRDMNCFLAAKNAKDAKMNAKCGFWLFALRSLSPNFF